MNKTIRQNLHTHSTFDDGKSSMEEMVQSAIAKGFSTLGFSGHSPNSIDTCSMSMEGMNNYLETFRLLKEKYKDQISLHCGIELDSLSDIDLSPFAYIIGSIHYLNTSSGPIAIDESRETFDHLLHDIYGGDIQKLTADYYAALIDMIRSRDFDILGHIDLITKYNEDETYFPFTADWYLEQARKAVDAGIEKGVIFEMNTGAISRGYRTMPYPHASLLDYMAKKGAKLCINTDCHNAIALDQSMNLSLTLARQAGFTHLYAPSEDGFSPVSIDSFAGELD